MEKIIRNPVVGTALAVAAGLSFYVLCIMLPLVGPAGSKSASANQIVFLSVLCLTILLAAGSAFLVLKRRKFEEAVAFPRFACGLTIVCLLMLLTLFVGGFAV